MDNVEEKNNQENSEEKTLRSENGEERVRYKKVNVYDDNDRSYGRAPGRAYHATPYRREGQRGYQSYRGSNYRNDGYHREGESYGNGAREYNNRYGSRPNNDSYGHYNRPYAPKRGYSRDNYGGGYGERRTEGGYAGGYPSQRGQRGGYQQRRSNYGNAYGAQRGYRKGGNGGGFNADMKYDQHRRIQYVEDNFDPDAPIRLNKFLSNAGVCSRRDADKYIQAGVVTVNGVTVTELGTKIKRSDEVRFNNETVSIEKKVYVLLNKPKDYVTTSDDPQNRKTVLDLVRNACRERIYPVGRLDRNTTGVLLLTNDGELASKLTHPKFKKKKIYHVFLDHNVSAADMQRIADGIQLDDGEVHADAIEYASPTDKKQVGIEIHSGRNRIVRRIFESMGYHVMKLDRVYFAGLTKKNLKRGEWRFLTQEEVNYLKMGEFE